MQESFTSQDVIRLTGITARQLQWWDEKRIVVPARQGHRRIYSFADVTEVAVICELRSKGFSLQRMRKVVRFLQKEFGKRLVEFDRKLPRGAWMLGGEWDHDRTFAGKLPTAAMLDKYVPDRPVLLRRWTSSSTPRANPSRELPAG